MTSAGRRKPPIPTVARLLLEEPWLSALTSACPRKACSCNAMLDQCYRQSLSAQGAHAIALGKRARQGDSNPWPCNGNLGLPTLRGNT